MHRSVLDKWKPLSPDSLKAGLNIFLSSEKEQKGGIMKKKGAITKTKISRIFY